MRLFRSLSSDCLAPVGDEQLIRMRELFRQQTVESIFQLQGTLPNWFRLTHALVLVAAARATLG
jgi:hypothetical protein